jgi:hypothetical protein
MCMCECMSLGASCVCEFACVGRKYVSVRMHARVYDFPHSLGAVGHGLAASCAFGIVWHRLALFRNLFAWYATKRCVPL